MAENAITGNAAQIDGLQLGTTTPNRSTRSQFSTVAAIKDSDTSVGGNLSAVAGVDSSGNAVNVEVSKLDASGNFTANASTITGVTDASGFNGASAISGRTVAGILNSNISVGGDINQSNPDASGNAVLGDLRASAIATANSTASATTADSAAAVVDLASVGLQDARVSVGGNARTLKFSAEATGSASAKGITVGSVSDTPSNSNPQGIDGPNSILNLNVRGLSPQTTYYQDPISPFFTDFGGLTTDFNFGSNLFNIDGSGSTPVQAASPSPSSPLGTVAVEGQLYAADDGELLFDASGNPLFSSPTIVDASGFLTATGASNAENLSGAAADVTSGSSSPALRETSAVKAAVAGQLFDASGRVLFTDASGLNPATIPVGIVDGSGNSVSIGGDGNIEASAQAEGKSTSRNITGDNNASSGVFSAGATLIGNANIGGEGNIKGTSRVGMTAAEDTAFTNSGFNTATLVDANGLINNPNTTSAIETASSTTTGSNSADTKLLSIGLGTSAVRVASPLTGNAGAGDLSTSGIPLAGPASATIGTNGTVEGVARNVALTDSKATTGPVVGFTGGLTTVGGNTFDYDPLKVRNAGIAGTGVTDAQLSGGSALGADQGNALTVGIFNMDITGGGSHADGSGTNKVLGDGVAVLNTSASSTTGPVRLGGSAITGGIFGADLSSGSLQNTKIKLGRNGTVEGYADSVNTTSGKTVAGELEAANASTTAGIFNVNLDLGNNVDVTTSARSADRVSGEATTGDVVLAINNNTAGLLNSAVNIGGNGGVSSIASASNKMEGSAITGSVTVTSFSTVVAIENSPIVIGGNGSLNASASMTSTVG